MNLLGKISLLISLFSFLLTLGFRIALPGSIPFISVGFIGGLVFLAIAIGVNLRFFRAALTSESLHFIGKSLLGVTLSLLLLATLNFILFKKNVTSDFTENKIHSLSPLSVSLAKEIDEDLIFSFFHVNSAQLKTLSQQVSERLEPYKQYNSHIKFQSYSVFERPDLVKKFKVGDEASSLFAEYKGRIHRVTGLDEVAITNTLLKLSKPAKKIYFSQGFEERRLDGENSFGLSGIKEQLERLHYSAEALTDFSDIPKDAAMIVFVGPRKVMAAENIQALKDYLAAGGTVLMAADPGEEFNPNPITEEFGLKLSRHFIYASQVQAGQSELLSLTHSAENQHEVAQSIKAGENPALFISSSVEIENSGDATFRASGILNHLPGSVGRSDLDDKAPVVADGELVAAAVSEGQKSGLFRLALVGDSDFLTNQFYQKAGNFSFVVSLFNFLSRDDDLLSMRPPVPKTTYLVITKTQMNLYVLFFILPLSLVFFVVALFFKLRRLF